MGSSESSHGYTAVPDEKIALIMEENRAYFEGEDPKVLEHLEKLLNDVKFAYNMKRWIYYLKLIRDLIGGELRVRLGQYPIYVTIANASIPVYSNGIHRGSTCLCSAVEIERYLNHVHGGAVHAHKMKTQALRRQAQMTTVELVAKTILRKIITKLPEKYSRDGTHVIVDLFEEYEKHEPKDPDARPPKEILKNLGELVRESVNRLYVVRHCSLIGNDGQYHIEFTIIGKDTNAHVKFTDDLRVQFPNHFGPYVTLD